MTTDTLPTTGLLISQDLFFASKITGTAAELGYRVDVVSASSDASEKISSNEIRCILIDLATPGLVVEEFVTGLPQDNRPKLIAFGSHVDTVRLDSARDAGCDLVLPRSRFTATLPELLQQFLSE